MWLASIGVPLVGLALFGVAVMLHPFAGAEAASGTATHDAQLGVVITGDVRGYLEPCGCSEHMLGGVDRAAAQVDVAKKELGAAVHIAAGDTLFAAPPVDAAHGQQDQLKAKTILGADAIMNTVALAIGPRDLPGGPPAIAEVKPPFPVIGLGQGPGFTVSKQGDIQLGVATGSDPAQLISNVKAAKAAGAEAVIALAQFPLTTLLPQGTQLKAAGADVAVIAHQAADTDGEANNDVDAGLPVLTLMNRGRAIARVDFHRVAGAPPGFVPVTSGAEQAHDLQLRDAEIDSLKKRAHLAESPLKEAMDKKIAEKQAQRDALAAQKPAPPAGRSWLSTQFVELSDDKPRSQAGHALIEKFDADVSQLNLAWARAHGVSCPAAKPGEPAFAGTASCIACHAEPGEVYKGTEHSHAYATLEKVHKQFDLDCVRCHVVGTNAPGGVCRVDQVEGRKNVGCESCHGRGSLHADDPNVPVPVPEPGEQNCRVCHTPENSTAFDYATYLPKILGPGHGKPSAK